MNKITYHKHHIVPKHMGGSNDLSNLITLTVSEHAVAHQKLWEEYKKEEDYIAWKALSGQASMPEIKAMVQRLGSTNGSMKAKMLNEQSGGALARMGGLATRDMKVGIHAVDYDKGIGGRIGGKLIGPTTKDRRWFTNGVIDTRIHINNIDLFKKENPDWYEGRAFRHISSGTGKTRNTVWVSLDGKRKRIKVADLDTFIRLGYVQGMGQTAWNPASSHKKS
jgi:hypothetical protein